jgi:hypothetical protein
MYLCVGVDQSGFLFIGGMGSRIHTNQHYKMLFKTSIKRNVSPAAAKLIVTS